jgi:fibro-slime domain-containing protein
MLKYINLKKITSTVLLVALSVGVVAIESSTATDSAPDTITLTGTIRDFKAQDETNGHPDFERTPGVDGFNYGSDRGITTDTIGSDKKPVYAGGSYSTTNQTNFDKWYRDVPEVNKSTEYSITLEKQSDGTYRYSNNNFFPINGQLWGNYASTGKNFHFTYELHSRFTYKRGQKFKFTGDDDVWVYINGKKVIDLGGVHSAEEQEIDLDTLGLTDGQRYDFDFFFAERHTTESNFTISTSIELNSPPDALNNSTGSYAD